MSIEGIKQQIEQAVAQEQQDHVVELVLQENHSQIARLIKLDPSCEGKQLLNFVILYTKAVPYFLTELGKVAKELDLTRYVQPIVDMVLEFFNQTIGPKTGLVSLMVKAYLSNRFLEEINDLCIFHANEPMICVDLAMTNAVVHDFIGTPFADDLDQVVQSSVKQLFDGNYYEDHIIEPTNLVPIFRQMPNLIEQAGLYTRLI